MIDGVAIAFHMHKDDCPTVLMFFNHCHCYSTILLQYLVVVDHQLSLYCTKIIANTPVILMIEVVKSDSWCYNSFSYAQGCLSNSSCAVSSLLSNNTASIHCCCEPPYGHISVFRTKKYREHAHYFDDRGSEK